ncbi:type II CAAX endopeptidase family protein [Paenibacillus zeisoli]|nr:type II CAAX endopeptidase family protein [Paenibacillus zeisoli]
MKTFKTYFFTLGEVILLAGIFLAVAVLHNYVLVPNSGSYGQYLMHNLPLWISIMFAIDAVLLTIYFLIKKSILKDRYVKVSQLCNFSRLKGKDFLISTYVAIAAGLLFVCLLKLPFVKANFPDMQDYINLFMNSDSFILTLLGLAVIGPLFEEIFFRGILFSMMRGKLPFLVALLVQAVIYGYCQPSSSIQVTGFFLAIMYGIMYTKMKTILSTIWTGVLLNAFIFTSKQIGLHEVIEGFSPSTLLIIIALCLFVIVSSLIVLGQEERKLPYIKVIGNLLLWTGLYVVIYYPILFIWNNHIMSIASISGWLGENNVLGFIFFDTISLAVFYVVMRLIHKKSLIVECNFSAIPPRAGIVMGILGAAMGVWVQCFFKIPYFADNFPQFQQLFDYLTTASLPVFIAFLILHSMYKEVYFRALIYNVLRPAFSVPMSIIVTGIIYGGLFFNWDIPLTIYASAGALIFGLLFEWYRSIWAPIINEIVLFGTYFVMKKLQLTFSAGIVIAMVASSVVIIYTMYWLWKRREIDQENANSAHVQAAVQSAVSL